MQDLTAKRTLVKSQPELWEELSEVERLAKHLGEFGEIRITKLEPEHKVAWEGEHASGTVSIEPSGWGTKVVLTAELTAEPDEPDPGEADAPEPTEEADPQPEVSATEVSAPADGVPVIEIEERGTEPEPVAQPEPVAEPEPEADPTPAPPTMVAEQPRRRRRGFWSRLFAGWLVPEERMNAAPSSASYLQLEEPTPPTPPTPEPPVHDGAEEEPAAVVEPEAPEPAQETAVAQIVADEPVSKPQGLRVEVEAEPREPMVESVDDATDAEGPAALDHERAQSVLEETLEALGSAHHRPFSRG
jgi:hypothetical protein